VFSSGYHCVSAVLTTPDEIRKPSKIKSPFYPQFSEPPSILGGAGPIGRKARDQEFGPARPNLVHDGSGGEGVEGFTVKGQQNN
jgi:hypothetical protein